MYKDIKRLALGSISMFILLFIAPAVAIADEGLNFLVQPIFPESQVEGSSNYFDLNLAPGATEILNIEIQNDSEEEILVQINPHTAYTNVNGVVEYGKDAASSDPTLMHSLAELIDEPDVISLKGNEKKIVPLHLNMPDIEFSGILAGGISIKEVPKDKEKQEEDEQGIALKNEFAYVIGVIASNNRSEVKPELDILDVFPNQLNYRNVVSVTIQNYTPTYVNHLSIKGEVRKIGEDDILYETQKDSMQMAPNSHFDFPIPLNGESFKNGKYELVMSAHSNEHEWTWTKQFTIQADEARKLNKLDVEIESETNIWMITTIGFGALLLGVIIYRLCEKLKKY